jgi:hypothetical protein
MKPNIRVLLALVAGLLVAGVVFHQQKEMHRLRAVIAELTNLSREETAISMASTPLPADIEELRRQAAEVHRLRAEITQLRRRNVEASALQARIDKLTLDLDQRPDSIDIFGDYAPPASPLVLQASSLAQSSPEEAARWAAALPPGKEQDAAVLAVINQWTGTNPVAAAAWTTQFAEGPLRERAMSVVARHWGQSDWNATAGWLETLPTGSSRDAAIGAFVTSADGYDIKLALEWANRMEAPDNRAMRVEDTARRWLREDNAAARAWLEEAQLPPGDSRATVLGKIVSTNKGPKESARHCRCDNVHPIFCRKKAFGFFSGAKRSSPLVLLVT